MLGRRFRNCKLNLKNVNPNVKLKFSLVNCKKLALIKFIESLQLYKSTYFSEPILDKLSEQPLRDGTLTGAK